MEAEEFARFGGGESGVGRETIKMVETGAGGPGGKGGFALTGEVLLEAVEILAGLGITRRDGAASAGVAAFKVDFADGEADNAPFVFAEELVFPEGGQPFAESGPLRADIQFERGAEPLADVVQREAGEPLEARRKPFATQGTAFETRSKPFGPRSNSVGAWGKPVSYGLEGGGGDDGGAVGDGVVGETSFGIADDDLLLEEDGEPLGGVFVIGGEGEGACGNVAAIVGDGEGDGGKVGGISGADEMDRRSALAVDPFAVDSIEGPGAIKGEATRRGDAGFGDVDRIKRFDWMKANVGESGSDGHGEILAEEKGFTTESTEGLQSSQRRA